MKFHLFIILFILQISAFAQTNDELPPGQPEKLPYEVEIEDQENVLQPLERIKFLENFDAAIFEWSRWVYSKGKLKILITISSNLSPEYKRSGGFSGAATMIEQWGEYRIHELNSTHKMRTGEPVPGEKYDITIYFTADHYKNGIWVDPVPKTRLTPVPEGKNDLVTVFSHDLGTAFGMDGYIDMKVGGTQGNVLTPYDKHVFRNSKDGENHVVFKGPNAKRINGGKDVPIFFAKHNRETVVNRDGLNHWIIHDTDENFYKYGYFHSSHPESDHTFYGLMAAVWTRKTPGGVRKFVGPLDAAILKDCGVPTHN